MHYFISCFLLSIFFCSTTFLSADRDAIVFSLSHKKYEEAVTLINKELSRDGDKSLPHDELLLHKANALFLLKKYHEAELEIANLLDNHTESEWRFKGVFLKAKLLIATGDYKKGMEIYQSQFAALASLERKKEIAQELINYGDFLSRVPEASDIDAPAPNFASAFSIYHEVLDLECGNSLREAARIKMIEMQKKLNNSKSVIKLCYSYLEEFDYLAHAKISSADSLTLQPVKPTKGKGVNIGSVRYALAEALHRTNNRGLAASNLLLLIKQIREKKLPASDGLLADAAWLRLHTLTYPGGMPVNMEKWLVEANNYLKNYPKHIHASKTAYLIADTLKNAKEYDRAITAFQSFIDNTYQIEVIHPSVTEEQETVKSFNARKKLGNKHKELAYFTIGSIYANQNNFEKAKSSWLETLKQFPNGEKWTLIQQGLVALDLQELLFKIDSITEQVAPEQKVQQVVNLIDAYAEEHPLEKKLETLLYLRGNVAHLLAEKAEEKKDHLLAKKLYDLSIKNWQLLINKYPKNNYSSKALELIGFIYADIYKDIDKAIDNFKQSNSEVAQEALKMFKSKHLVARTSQNFTTAELPFIELQSRNISKVKVNLYWVDPQAYFKKSRSLGEVVNLDVDLVEPDKSWAYDIKDYKKALQCDSKIELPFEDTKSGLCIVKVETDELQTTTFVQRSDIDIAAKISDKEIITYIKNSKTNSPQADVKLFISTDAKILIEGKTNADGVFHTKEIKDFSTAKNIRVLAVHPSGHAMCNFDSVAIQSASNSNSSFSSSPIKKTKTWFHWDRDEVRPGNMLSVTGVVREYKEGEFLYPERKKYQLKITHGAAILVDKLVTLSDKGVVTERFRIPSLVDDKTSIQVNLMQSDEKTLVFETWIQFTKHAQYVGRAEVVIENDYISVGDIIKGKVKVNLSSGAPLASENFMLGIGNGLDIPLKTDGNGEAEFSYDTTYAESSGRALNFRPKFSNISLFTANKTVRIEPVDLKISASVNRDIITAKQKVKVKIETLNEKNKNVSTGLKVTLLKKEIVQNLSISKGLKGTSILMKKQDEFSLTTNADTGEVSVDFNPVEEGVYYLKIIGKDNRGVEVKEVVSFQVIGAQSENKLTISTEKKDLYDDHEVTVDVYSNLSETTHALMTLERDTIISYKVISLSQGLNTITIPLNTKFSPRFNVSISSIDERKIHYAIMELQVAKKLSIHTEIKGLGANGEAEAGGSIDASIYVADSQGRVVPAIVFSALNPTQLASIASVEDQNIVQIFDNDYAIKMFGYASSTDFKISGKQEVILASIQEENNAQGGETVSAHFSALPNKSQRIENHLRLAGQFANGRNHALAHRELDSILRIDPYNREAIELQALINRNKGRIFNGAYDESRRRLLTEVDNSWEIPLASQKQGNISLDFGSQDGFGTGFGDGDELEGLFVGEESKVPSAPRAVFDSVRGNDGLFSSKVIKREAISSFLSLPPARSTAQVFKDSSLPVWSKNNIPVIEKTNIKIPLPKQPANWILRFSAVSHKGHLDQANHLINTTKPYIVSLAKNGRIVAGESFKPEVIIHRKNTEAAETLPIIVEITSGGKLMSYQYSLEFAKEETTSLVSLPKTIAIAGEDLLFRVSNAEKGIKFSQSLYTKNQGIWEQHYTSIHASKGEAGIIDLSKYKLANQDDTYIKILPSFGSYINDLYALTVDGIGADYSPLSESHPAGKLLAATSLLKSLKENKQEKTQRYNTLRKEAKWHFDELIASANVNGYWTNGLGSSHDSLIHTVFSYIAISQWQKISDEKTDLQSKVESWLQSMFSKQSNDNELKALIQMALAFEGKHDFSQCNRLFRDNENLSAAAKLFLAQAFIQIDRKSFAVTLIKELFKKPVEKWDGNDYLTENLYFLLGIALWNTSALDQNELVAMNAYREKLFSGAYNTATNDLIKAVVIMGLTESHKDEASKAIAVGTGKVLLDKKEIQTFDLAEPETLMINLAKTPLHGSAKLNITFAGTGSVYATAVMNHYRAYSGVHKVDKQAQYYYGVEEKHYYHEGLKIDGYRLRSQGNSWATNVAKGKRITVAVKLANYDKDHSHCTLVEKIPTGFSYIPTTLRGGHNGAKHADGRLIINFDSKFKTKWLFYEIKATAIGTWHAEPSVLYHMANDYKPLPSKSTTLEVLAEGRKTTDPYEFNNNERYELAQWYYNQKQYTAAQEHINALFKVKRYNGHANLAKMTLWIEADKETPNAKSLVNAFEILDAKLPELVIPFEIVNKAAQAYAELGEYERAYYVYTALIEASFEQESFICIALEKQDRFMDALDYHEKIWSKYPNSQSVNSSWYAYAQSLFDKASLVKSIKPRKNAERSKKITADDLYKESLSMMETYLMFNPEEPTAEEASYTVATTLFSLKNYQGLVTKAKAAIEAYPESQLKSSFRYMVALGSFWQRDYNNAISAATEVASGDSEDKDLAAYITAQIYHTKGDSLEAAKWYEKVKGKYPDAKSSIAYFEQKKISMKDIQVLTPQQKVHFELSHRNVEKADIKVYKVDLMKLYLMHKDLNNISSVNLAGITPMLSLSKELANKGTIESEKTKIALPITQEGAYLILCRGDYLYASGLVLVTPLCIDVQELDAEGCVRVNIKDSISKQFVDGVAVKAIGSESKKFVKGLTDMRGVWRSPEIQGYSTVIAKDKNGRYAFYRGAKYFRKKVTPETLENKSLEKVDYKSNFIQNQMKFNKKTKSEFEQYRYDNSKIKGLKINRALKK